MSKDDHRWLAEGRFKHQCEADSVNLVVKSIVIDEPEDEDAYITIARRRECIHGVSNFSIGIMSSHGDLPFEPAADKPERNCMNVVRQCSWHANYHWHASLHSRPKGRDSIKSADVIDTMEDMQSAYETARVLMAVDPLEVRANWISNTFIIAAPKWQRPSLTSS